MRVEGGEGGRGREEGDGREKRGRVEGRERGEGRDGREKRGGRGVEESICCATTIETLVSTGLLPDVFRLSKEDTTNLNCKGYLAIALDTIVDDLSIALDTIVDDL